MLHNFRSVQPSENNLPPIISGTTTAACNKNILQDLCASSELGTWNDGGGGDGEGWERELVIDESDVIQESKFAIKEKRRQERQHKHQAQKSFRAQQKTAGSHPILGIKSVS